MLTRCPGCQAVFRVLAEQLRMARGVVQCGRCGARFDAVASLIDESATAPAAPSASDPPAAAPSTQKRSASSGPSARGYIVGLDDTLPPARAAVDEVSLLSSPQEFEYPEAALDQDLRREFYEEVPEIGYLQPQNGGEDPASAEAIATTPNDVLLQDVPRFLLDREDAAALRGTSGGEQRPRASSLWGIGSALLFICLLGQALWFEREGLVGRFPALRDFWHAVCAGRACALEPQRDLHSLQILSRDVRDHPRYRDSLLVNATLVNEAAFAQPFPVLELTLFNQAGHPLGVRRFEPGEYLDASIPVASGMKPHQQIYVALEIASFGDAAVSFEFRFL